MDEQITGEESAATKAEDADMRLLEEEIRNLPVADHVLYMMHSLSALAVGRLGLSGEAQPERDLDQARLAIDAFKALLEVVEGVRIADAAAHRGMLSQLQLAYVAALDDRGAGAGPDEATHDAEAPPA